MIYAPPRAVLRSNAALPVCSLDATTDGRQTTDGEPQTKTDTRRDETERGAAGASSKKQGKAAAARRSKQTRRIPGGGASARRRPEPLAFTTTRGTMLVTYLCYVIGGERVARLPQLDATGRKTTKQDTGGRPTTKQDLQPQRSSKPEGSNSEGSGRRSRHLHVSVCLALLQAFGPPRPEKLVSPN